MIGFFSPKIFTATLALIGAVIVIAALLSRLIERSGLPQVIMKNSHNVCYIAAPEGALDIDTPKNHEQSLASNAARTGDLPPKAGTHTQ